MKKVIILLAVLVGSSSLKTSAQVSVSVKVGPYAYCPPRSQVVVIAPPPKQVIVVKPAPVVVVHPRTIIVAPSPRIYMVSSPPTRMVVYRGCLH